MGREEVVATLREFKRENAGRYGIVSLGVFGSVARGAARDDSDVDICIQTETPDAFALFHLKEEIESRLRRRVDLVRVREKMNAFLRKRIEREAIYV